MWESLKWIARSHFRNKYLLTSTWGCIRQLWTPSVRCALSQLAEAALLRSQLLSQADHSQWLINAKVQRLGALAQLDYLWRDTRPSEFPARLTEVSIEAWLFPFPKHIFFSFLPHVLIPKFLIILLHAYMSTEICFLASSTCDNSEIIFQEIGWNKNPSQKNKLYHQKIYNKGNSKECIYKEECSQRKNWKFKN